MGYVEMIKLTKDGHIAITLNDGEIKQEKALQCDICRRMRPESKMMTQFIGMGDDWILECDECRK